jgi:hypothetical protein
VGLNASDHESPIEISSVPSIRVRDTAPRGVTPTRHRILPSAHRWIALHISASARALSRNSDSTRPDADRHCNRGPFSQETRDEYAADVVCETVGRASGRVPGSPHRRQVRVVIVRPGTRHDQIHQLRGEAECIRSRSIESASVLDRKTRASRLARRAISATLRSPRSVRGAVRTPQSRLKWDSERASRFGCPQRRTRNHRDCCARSSAPLGRRTPLSSGWMTTSEEARSTGHRSAAVRANTFNRAVTPDRAPGPR